MKRNFSLILVAFILLVSCNSTEIDNCKVIKYDYSNLPRRVKEVIFKDEYIELNTPKRFRLTQKQDGLLPWVYNNAIVREKDGKVFKLNFKSEHGSSYVILEDFLYVPRHYNVFKSDSLKYEFSRFQLD